ncbi:MAG: imidazoleglycerol-phosphate dehydratase HisB [Deltaproteobacteria bacterium]|nr:imidazoleglycerol-phosphate dehydratase HisB [Deltaproteobacteria bacterium]
MPRKAKVKRKTRETDISVEMNLDGRGDTDIKTPVPFFTHMLSSLSKHALFDLKIRAKGDIEVDLHHTVEDVGLILGEAFKEAVGDKRGIVRCGSSSVPMMDSLATAVVDISGRPYFKFNSTKDSFAVTGIFSKGPESMKEAFNMDLLQEFMKAFSNSAGIDLHITVPYGRDIHHAIESIFKALGRALSAAAAKDPRIKGVMSTKGRL